MGAARVGIIDYGVGNLKSVSSAIAAVGAQPLISADPVELAACDRLILPGVGAFRHGMQALISASLDDFVKDSVAGGKPLFGICLGMQMLTELSEEFGESKGLAILPGRISRLENPEPDRKLRLPNVAWLNLSRLDNARPALAARVFEGIDEHARFYFIHSYAAAADNPAVAATSDFEGISFASVIARDNVIGTQFHPEKSGPQGLKMLRNFVT